MINDNKGSTVTFSIKVKYDLWSYYVISGFVPIINCLRRSVLRSEKEMPD